MDQLPKSAAVLAKGIRAIESIRTQTAERTAPFLIERRSIQKRSVAMRAKIFCYKRLRSRKAGGTNGNAGELLEWIAADAAIIREDKGEQGCREDPDSGGVDMRPSE